MIIKLNHSLRSIAGNVTTAIMVSCIIFIFFVIPRAPQNDEYIILSTWLLKSGIMGSFEFYEPESSQTLNETLKECVL